MLQLSWAGYSSQAASELIYRTNVRLAIGNKVSSTGKAISDSIE